MKKIRILLLVLSVIFLLSGTFLQVFIHYKGSNDNAADNTCAVESEKKEPVYDFLNSKTKEEIETLSKKDGLKVDYQKTFDNKDTVVVSGYKFNGDESVFTFYLNDDNSIDYFEGEIFSFIGQEKIEAESLKDKCEKAVKCFADRFSISSYQYNIIDSDGNYLNTDSIESYQKIADKSATLEFFVKDTDGFIWVIRTYYDPSYNIYLFHLNKLMDLNKTENMYCDIDLSKLSAEGNGK